MKKFTIAAALTTLGMSACDASAKGVASEVQAKGPSGPLAGILIEAGKKSPLILILPGSGPTDRDGNSPIGVKASTYRLLAEALATRGVSTLRADKRGMFGSKAATPVPNAVTIAGYAKDVASWIAAAQQQNKRQCVWLLGHSEGGLVALTAAQQNKSVCGVILAAAPGRKLADIMRQQIDANPANAPIKPDAMRTIAALEAGKKVDVTSMHPALQGLFNPAVQPFLIDLFQQDPAKLAARLGQPLIIIQGGRDSQVTVDDAKRLAAAQPKARLLIVPEMTHILKNADDDSPQANLATYADPLKPVTPQVVDFIVASMGKP